MNYGDVATAQAAGRPRSRGQDFLDKAAARLLKLPPATTRFTVIRNLRIPARDGVELLADLYAPSGPSKGTVLVRSPYGYSAIMTSVYAVPYAARGFHVILARCRGTFGSGGGFDPMVREIDDAADTVAWLRDQPWFGGRFATLGLSYLGFTQWALLMDPPPELAAAVIQVGPHDFSRSAYYGGAFNLNDFLGWSEMVAFQEQLGPVRALLRAATAARRQTPAMSYLPMADAADELCDGRAHWYRKWVRNRDLSAPFWAPMQLGEALDRVQVPVLLQSGWQDLFLQQTLEQYAHLRERGLDVALTVGPWTHLQMVTKAAPKATAEALGWLGEHLGGTAKRTRTAPVEVFVTGAKEWRELPSWPPPGSEQVLYPLPAGGLGGRPAAGAPAAQFTYDPSRPTPSVGGRLLSSTGGYRDDSALAERDDVLAFTGSPLPAALEVAGVPVAELAHSSDNPHADLFVRICDVDAKGQSRNVSDGFARLDPERGDGVVRIELDAVAHQFAAGHRIRLLVAGGAYPRWERNLGTAEDPAASTALLPSSRRIDLAASRVLLPVPE